jgi:hypothetical protein
MPSLSAKKHRRDQLTLESLSSEIKFVALPLKLMTVRTFARRMPRARVRNNAPAARGKNLLSR